MTQLEKQQFIYAAVLSFSEGLDVYCFANGDLLLREDIESIVNEQKFILDSLKLDQYFK